MKIMICEMCGSQNLLKQDGVFVCQHCGTRYSVEEARKMMTDGPVDVSGSTVKIDNTNKLANLYEAARRAKNDENYSIAAKYYEMILLEDPRSWEAVFYNTYFTTIQTNIANIASAAATLSNCLRSSVTLLNDSSLDEDAKKQAILEMVAYSYRVASAMVTTALDHYHGISQSIREKYTKETIDRVLSAAEILLNFGNQIEDIFEKDPVHCKCAVIAWQRGLDLLSKATGLTNNTKSMEEIKSQYITKIAQYDDKVRADLELQTLKKKIEDVKNTISSAHTERFPYLAVGIVIFVICGIIAFVNMFFLYHELYILVYICSLAGFLLFALGIIACLPQSDAKIEKNKKIRAEANEKLAALEAELAKLEAQNE